MESTNEQNAVKTFFDKCPLFSLLAGILGMTSCCSPPIQLVFGMTAILLAYLSKNGKPRTSMAMFGTVLGVISVIISLLVFGQYVFAMHLMEDPANASLVKEVFQQYQGIMNSIMETQGN